MRFTRSAAALALILLATQASFAQVQTGTIPYAKLYSLQKAFIGIAPAERDKLGFSVVLKHDDPANHAPIGLYVEQGGKQTPIPVSASGALDLPSREDWAKQALLVHTDQPKGSLTVTISLAILQPAPQSAPVGYLLAAMKQAQGALRTGYRQIGGLAGAFAVPTLRVVRVKLAGCCGQTARFQASQDVLPPQDSTGMIVLPLAKLQAHPTDTIAFSAKVQSLDADER